MGRIAAFPPKIKVVRGYARLRWKGKDYHLGPAGSQQADAAYKKLLVTIAQEVAAQPRTMADPTVATLAAAYLAHEERRRAGKRDLENVRALVHVLVRSFGKLPARRFRAAQLEQMQEVMASGSWLTVKERCDRRKNRQPVGWCRNVINLSIRRVRSIFKWAERNEHVPDGTHSHLQTVPAIAAGNSLARETTPRQPSRLEDVEAVAAHCPPAVAAMLLLQWWTGARTGEVLIMRTMDIDRSGEVWLYTPGSDLPWGRHKNTHRRQTRVIPVGPEAKRLLLPWLKPDFPMETIFRPSANRAVKTEYNRHSYARAVNRACARAGVKLQAYQGRHAFKRRATRAMGLDAAAAAMGHASTKTTAGYATGIDMDLATEVARQIG